MRALLLLLVACGRVGFEPREKPRDAAIGVDAQVCDELVDRDGDGVPCSRDCDDSDATTFPGQTDWFAVPRANGTYDYDCDGVETLEQPDVVTCVDDGNGNCTGFGWIAATAPDCGVKEQRGGCGGMLPACEVLGIGPPMVQSCH